nr:probable leucine-rich repeat receptor-like protein kinase At1g35710 [Tanacetum cinerariifolium]
YNGLLYEDGRYIKNIEYLYLSNNNISGLIPESIGLLSKLELEQNKLSGSIPASISGLVSVQLLILSNNELTGVIPSSIGKLSNIQKLVFDNNKLSGKLPASIGHLITLRDIFLNNNRFTGRSLKMAQTGLQGSFPQVLLSSSTIWQLDLSSNSLTGDLPPLIGNMTNLILLNLSNNGFSNVVIRSEFKNLSSLTDLDLHSNNFTGDINFIFKKNVPEIPGFFSSIDLSYNPFSGPIKVIGDEPALVSTVSLVLSHNPIGGKIPKSLSNATELSRLLISNNNLEGKIPKELNKKSLKELDVSGNRLTGEIPVHDFSFHTSAFLGNPGLCGAPLQPCYISL